MQYSCVDIDLLCIKLLHMIKKIGIQNFRVFKEFTEFEIRPITLLVGLNNAGKSSFTKLLLLLKNGINKLNFNEGLHKLDSFRKVLNWDTDKQFLKIRYDNKLEFLDDSFCLDALYKLVGVESQMVGVTISNSEESLLSFSPTPNPDNNSQSYQLNFNINLMMSLIYNDKTTSFSEIEDNRVVVENYYDEDGMLTNEIRIINYEGDLTIENFEEVFKNNKLNMGSLSSFGRSHIGLSVLKHEIRKLDKDYLLYDIFVNGEIATQYYKEEIIELQKLWFSKIKMGGFNDISQIFDDCLSMANEQVKRSIQKHFAKSIKEDSLEIKETRLGRLLLTEKLFDSANVNSYAFSATKNKTTNYQKNFFQQFNSFSRLIAKDFSRIEYISAHRGSQQRILKNNSENDIDKIVLDFFNTSAKNIIYVEKVFSILEIPGKLTVERFENVISVVYLIINDKEVALSDVGFGFSQLIPIILKIATITTSKLINLEATEAEWNRFREIEGLDDSVLIIEEPEANLHPSLQSKLADMLVATIEYYPDIRFVIETHSEYLIRKLQFLTAKKSVGTDKSIIYYFNADNYVTAKEPKVKPIEIRENGNLSDTFGPGFYDETTRLQFDLMKLNQEQNN